MGYNAGVSCTFGRTPSEQALKPFHTATARPVVMEKCVFMLGIRVP